MKIEHHEIIKLIVNYLEQNPEQRFGQALFNLGINEFINNTDPGKDDYKIRDIHGDADENIITRIKTRLELFEKQRKSNG